MGLQELRIAGVGMTAKSAALLGKALAANKRHATSLRVLDAHDNAMGTVSGLCALAFTTPPWG